MSRSLDQTLALGRAQNDQRKAALQEWVLGLDSDQLTHIIVEAKKRRKTATHPLDAMFTLMSESHLIDLLDVWYTHQQEDNDEQN